MHPGFIGWWQQQRSGHMIGHECECGPHGCGPAPSHGGGCHNAAPSEDFGTFGVRRPLRFLAHKLELSDEQVAKVATILNGLKTERAQAEVDQRRRIASIADAFESNDFEVAKIESAGQTQVVTAERLKQAVTGALRELHTVLDESQRKKLAYLLRTGVLSL